MLTLIKQLRFYVKSAVTSTFNKYYTSDKPLDLSQGLDNRPIFPSPSSPAKNADTSIQNSSRRKEPHLTSYSGIQKEIYD